MWSIRETTLIRSLLPCRSNEYIRKTAGWVSGCFLLLHIAAVYLKIGYIGEGDREVLEPGGQAAVRTGILPEEEGDMSRVEIGIVAIMVFVVTGVLAYVIESVVYRRRGIVRRNESLLEYYKKIDQKQGNIAAAVWALIWIALMILAAVIIYLLG